MIDLKQITSVPELLAPAGDMDSLRAAIAAGADAVYLGGHAFNARIGAGNFDHQQLLAARDLTSRHGLRAYITFNTLVGEQEIETSLNELEKMYQAGFDAVIMQDLGLAMQVRRIFPDWEVHASTQMSIHNLAAAKKLVDAGFGRIIPARELTFPEIKEWASAGIPIEVFVHGAICYSYSGQCLMSSFIGGRSGNRGRCAQPCRMEYSLAVDGEIVDTNGNYLLSTKDMNLSHRLPELAAAGVKSLKIEGRMKRPEYVWTVTSVYRRLLDSLLEGTWSESLLAEGDAALEQAFSRGFTEGSAFATPADVIGANRPNNRGVCIGRIVNFDERTLRANIRLDQSLQIGDGVEVWVTKGGRIGAPVDRIWVSDEDVSVARAGEVAQIWLGKPAYPGDRVFRNQSSSLQQEVTESVEAVAVPGDVGLKFKLSGSVGENLILQASDELGHQAEVESQMSIQQAAKRPLDSDIALEKLGRLGDSGFYLQDLEFLVGSGAMIPVSELNRMRREAIHQLRQQRFARDQTSQDRKSNFIVRFNAKAQQVNKPTGNPKLYSLIVDNVSSVNAAADLDADMLLLPIDGRQDTFTNDAYSLTEAALKNNLPFALVLPRINRGKLDWDWIKISGASHIYAGNIGDLQEALDNGLDVWADWPLNAYNSLSLNILQKWGVSGIALSPELSLDEVKTLAGKTTLPLEVQIHGRMELMVSDYCAIKNHYPQCSGNGCKDRHFELVDGKGYRFPIQFDQYCRMHLLNSKVTAALTEQEDLWLSGVSRLRLDLSGASDWQVRKILFAYRQAVEKIADSERIRLDLQDTLGAGLTRGHMQRGVTNV